MIQLTDAEKEMLKQYAQVYDEERRNDITADPLVAVQVREEIPTSEDYCDGYVYYNGPWEITVQTIEELRKCIEEEYGAIQADEEVQRIEDDEDSGRITEFDKIPVIYRWVSVAFFLSRASAEKYCKYQSHNLTKPRVYTLHAGYSNCGDYIMAYQLLKRMGEELLEAANG